MNALTPRAFDAIVAQIAPCGNREMECYATVNGEQVIWTAFFEEEEDPYYGFNSRHEVCPATRCRFVGAYDSECTIAGNRDEMIALLGDAVIARWENIAEEEANE
jgi:hypothetical protein